MRSPLKINAFLFMLFLYLVNVTQLVKQQRKSSPSHLISVLSQFRHLVPIGTKRERETSKNISQATWLIF